MYHTAPTFMVIVTKHGVVCGRVDCYSPEQAQETAINLAAQHNHACNIVKPTNRVWEVKLSTYGEGNN